MNQCGTCVSCPPRPVAALAEYDLAQAQATGEQQNADERQAERKLIADHLGAGAQRAEQGILAVR